MYIIPLSTSPFLEALRSQAWLTYHLELHVCICLSSQDDSPHIYHVYSMAEQQRNNYLFEEQPISVLPQVTRLYGLLSHTSHINLNASFAHHCLFGSHQGLK